MTPLARMLLGGVRLYQLTLSSVLGGHCRFHPTCSVYAQEAIRTHGGLRGGWLALRRILRCHPFGGSGYDPVPPGPDADRDDPPTKETLP